VMLSGDKQSVVDQVAKKIGIDEAYGDLLPEGKVEKVQAIKDSGRHIAFVGDGVNDAPVVALADAGIAMGGLGSDATIETADIVIQNDQPSKIVSAIKAKYNIGNGSKSDCFNFGCWWRGYFMGGSHCRCWSSSVSYSQCSSDSED
jgi:P-type E1-E2 ATPase